MKQCEVCGRTDGKILGKNSKYGMNLCTTHMNQAKYRSRRKIRNKRCKLDPNEIKVNDDVLEITLYNSKGISVAIAFVDTTYLDLISGYKWSLDHDGYVVSGRMKLHRVITNASKGTVVDHINHNLLDNRSCNLRVCTNKENLWNQAKCSSNKSGYTGVYFHKRTGKWLAFINVNKVRIHLGLFLDINDAVRVRKEAEVKYFGNFRYNAG